MPTVNIQIPGMSAADASAAANDVVVRRKERADLVLYAVTIGKFVSIASQYINEPELRPDTDPNPTADRRARAVAINARLNALQDVGGFYNVLENNVSRSERGLKIFMQKFQTGAIDRIANAPTYAEAIKRAQKIMDQIIPLLGTVHSQEVALAAAAAASQGAGVAQSDEMIEALKCYPGTVWNPITQVCE